MAPNNNKKNKVMSNASQKHRLKRSIVDTPLKSENILVSKKNHMMSYYIQDL